MQPNLPVDPADNPHVDDGVHPTSQYFPSINPSAANPEAMQPIPFVAKTGQPDSEDLGVLTGVTSLEASNQFLSELTSDETGWKNLISGGAGMGLEVLAAFTDPFGYVGGQLLSWMLEHVEPLRAVLDGLAGNPDIIEAYAQSWNQVSAEMTSIATDFATAVNSSAGAFMGLAGDAYRTRAEDIRNLIDAAATAAQTIGQLTIAMGEVVAGVRTAVRDIATGLAGKLVANTAIALAVGPGTALAVAKSMKEIALSIAETSTYLARLQKVNGKAITAAMALRDLLDGFNNGFIEMQKA